MKSRDTNRSTSRMYMRSVGLAATLALILTACGRAGDEQSQEGHDLRVRIGSDVVSLHPHDRSTVENTSVQVHLYDALLGYDYETMEFQPELATDWSTSEDGLSFTFTLDPDATWHDGEPVTANDVVFSYNRVIDPDTASPHAEAFSLVESVEAIDDQTVEITLESPDMAFLHYVAASNQALILPEHVHENMDGEDFGQSPIGSGPYRFSSWTAGEGVTLERNEDYHGPVPEFETLSFVLIPEETVAETALRNGEIDVFWQLSDPLIIDRLEADADLQTQKIPSMVTCYVALDTQREPFDDVKVRQAAAYGMDTDLLLEDYFEGTKERAYTPLTSSHQEFTEDVPTYDYDPDRAAELLEEAGYSPGDAEFEFVTFSLNPFDEFPIPLLDNLDSAGFSTSMNVMERADFGNARSAGDLPTGIGCPPNGPHPDTTLRQVFHSENTPPGWNMSHYDGADKLLDEARTETDEDRRQELYAEVQQKIMEDLPVIPLYTEVLYQAHHSGVENLEIPPMWFFDARGSHPSGS